jgi:hypothetical protein
MGDGTGAFMYYVNGVDTSVGAAEQAVANGDMVEFFAMTDTTGWSDLRAQFAVDGKLTNAVTLLAGDALPLVLQGDSFGTKTKVQNAKVLQLAPAASASKQYNQATFDKATELAKTDENGAAQLAFAKPGVYFISAAANAAATPLFAPWLEVTVTERPKEPGWLQKLWNWILRYLLFGWLWMAK